MAKRKNNLTEKKIAKKIKEGRGQGIGKDYIPWIKVQDFSSKGRVSRVKGIKTGRVHHFQSDLETKYFYYLEWQDDVIDIREQYPLINRSLCMEIADKNIIKYPKINNTPIIMTTDFMITKIHKDRREENIVRTVKYSKDLEKQRTLEKLFIEKEYFKENNVDWGIVTDEVIPDVLVNNIKWVHKAYNLDDILIDGITRENLIYFRYELIERLKKEKNKQIKEVIELLEEKYKTPKGTFLYIFRNCIINKMIKVDMNKEISINKSINDISCRGDD